MRHALAFLLAWLSRQLGRASSLLAYGMVGVLRKHELREKIEAEWNAFGRSGWSSYPNLGEWEKEFYLRQLQPGERVLLVGCGSGRDLIGLIEQGIRCDGLDIARRAVAACRERLRERGLEARLFECEIEQAAFDTAYDAAVFTWFAYGYIPESGARVRSLAALRAALRPGGRVLLTYQVRPRGISRVPIAFARLLAVLTRSDWRPEHGDYLEVGGQANAPGVHFEHRFDAAEVVAEAQAAGFRVQWHDQPDEGRVVLVRSDRP